MGKTITQHATGTPECPVLALANIIHEILSYGGTNDTLLCSVWYGTGWVDLESRHIINMVRDTSGELKLHRRAIDHDLVGSH